ncbi:GNAT family N-acetyltransferase [Planococcus sp. FY231025]|uniref:GNAT family N-acetyltransferase n=1 Tax=Planococcus sp. FY231025 TaxID=3455699 RepID=UPI003F933CE2
MEHTIRTLKMEDLPYLEAMQTGIEDDYVKRIFERLVTTENNRLFGLFLGEGLASVCGYTIFAGSYAMIGRIRSDIRYRGKDLATKLTAHVLKAAFELPDIQWVGANTQEENAPARRVLEKLGLYEHPPLYGATTKDLAQFAGDAPEWLELLDAGRKKEWLERLYIKPGAVFPYECYYLFPASEALFSAEKIAEWQFFENASKDRMLILKKDFKKHYYLHAVYPWNDLFGQPGLWETIFAAYRHYAAQVEEEAFVWMDLSKEQAASLPEGHSFELPSAWVLYGVSRNSFNMMKNDSLSSVGKHD